jgi:uncharacterized protein (DUF1778 family)
MHENRKKVAMNKFPLRLMPSVRRVAEQFSQQEGVSLNQFINVAVAEKLAHLQHEEWLARRAKVTDASIAKAIEILDRPTKRNPEAGDDLPQGYVSVRRRYSHNSRRA